DFKKRRALVERGSSCASGEAIEAAPPQQATEIKCVAQLTAPPCEVWRFAFLASFENREITDSFKRHEHRGIESVKQWYADDPLKPIKGEIIRIPDSELGLMPH